MTASDKFAGQRLAWIENAVFDADLQLLPRLVLAAIGFRYLNEKTGDAWPSVARLASDLGRSETQIRAALRDLEASGHLAKTSRPGETNRYAPTMPPPRNSKGDPNGKPRGSKNQTPSEFRGVGLRFSEGDPNGIPLPTPCYIPVKEPCEEKTPPTPSSRSVKSKKVDAIDEAEFERFWKAYPRHEAKGTARQAFAKAITRVDVGILVAGAERYADERRHDDPKFTKYPATWLNAECWLDEPRQAHVLSSAASAGGSPRPVRRSASDVWAARAAEEHRAARTSHDLDETFENTLEGEIVR